MSGWPDSSILDEVTERLRGLHTRVEAACRRANRDPAEVTLVGACKRQPIERIAAAVQGGLAELGQNYMYKRPIPFAPNSKPCSPSAIFRCPAGA